MNLIIDGDTDYPLGGVLIIDRDNDNPIHKDPPTDTE